MSLTATPGVVVPPPPVRPIRDRIAGWAVWGGLALLLALSVQAVELNKLPLLFSNSQNMRTFAASFARPNLDLQLAVDGRFPFVHGAGALASDIGAMLLTLQIALWGTLLAILIAVPLGLLAARNVAPVWIQQPVRRLLDLMRSVPDLVMGTVFVVAVGLGPFAGVMALAVNTGGVLGKLFSEAVEAIDPRPVEGVRAVGASRLEAVAFGVLPQVAPLWTSYALYRFESNARAATVLGLIGAGGIGQALFDSINSFNYRDTAAIVLVIVVAVSLIDLLSQALRSRLV